MTLYEINQSILECLTIDPTTGEVTIDEEAMSALTLAKESKLEGIALWVKNLTAEAAAIAAEVKALAERKKAAENRAERLKAILGGELSGTKFSTPRVAVSFRTSEAVVITDEGALPPEFLRVKTTTDPDKVAIKAAIAKGETVGGAYIETKSNIQIK